MAVKVGINGFGRIGRMVLRAILERGGDEVDVVQINDLSDAETLGHLLKYDSVYGPLKADVKVDGANIVANGKAIPVSAERSPAKLPWKKLGVDVALESTGVFRTRESDKGGYGDHLKAGARKVVLSAPAKDEIDYTIVLGVNDDGLKADHLVVSNASCTTNCLAPVAKVLQDTFGIVKGLMTTIHSFTNDQRILDMIHSDLRRARAASLNIIPTTTGAAKAVGKVIPALAGKLDGMAVRVPTPVGSLVDLVVELEKDVTRDDINDAVKAAADSGPLAGYLQYCEEPIVSSDVIGNPFSSIFDSLATVTMPKAGGRMVKVLSWYDNELGYSQRTVDLILKLAAL
jgi:glyceraldehyde 3-phosphate dehydrogenase